MDNKNLAVQNSTATRGEKIKINRSKTGLPCVGVGGGAYSNTFVCRFVVRKNELAKAIFIKNRGHLACSTSQAIVPIQVGDILVDIEGRLPFVQENHDITVTSFKFVDIVQEGDIEYAYIIPTQYDIPEHIWKYVSRGIRYHNRNGEYFCTPP